MTLLDIRDLNKRYASGGRDVAALDGVSLTLAAGETLGLAGASLYAALMGAGLKAFGAPLAMLKPKRR